MSTRNRKNIAILPEDPNPDHEWCSICGDDNVVVVIQDAGTEQSADCYEGDNTIVLCSKHAGQMLRELAALNLGL